jgi:DtxR family Mn-dependent transcriptional regulator
MPQQTSPAAEDYLKTIYLLAGENPEARDSEKGVSTTAVSQRLGVSPASATNMLKRLDGMSLVAYTRYRGVELTDAGRKIALEVIRHHRLLETYLAEALGVPWDEVHKEAEVLEHVLSEGLEERISVVLGDPLVDPHGHPIPTKELRMPTPTGRRLWDASDGETMAVDHVSDDQPEVLRYLGNLGIRPGSHLEVVGRGPVSGPWFVRVPETSEEVKALSKELAESVWVSA